MKHAIPFLLLSCAALLMSACSRGGAAGQSESVTPEFQPEGGFYREAQTVSIACADAKAIYYTTDLSLPTEKSTRYRKPFAVQKQCVIRALAVKKDGGRRYAMTAFDFDTDRSTDYRGTALPSPVWRDQIIYFVVTDRFFNGDSDNDMLPGLAAPGGGAYDERQPLPAQPTSGYNGGDLKGVGQKLDYIKNLGATAIWLTPPVANQVSEGNYHGFHGYWASDFTAVDSHLGTLADYQHLVDEAHKRGLYVIQDIVVNHVGDYQKIADGFSLQAEGGMVKAVDTRDGSVTLYEPKDVPASVFSLNPLSVPQRAPVQLPWAFNDITKLTADELANNSFYHFNSKILDYNNAEQLYTWQTSDLDDLATENPVVSRLLRGYFRWWLDKTNIDGYRIDTVLYVNPEFFEGFINGTDGDNPGIRPYAASLGKEDFISFGEAWSTDEAVTSSYTRNRLTGAKRIDSVIYFPLRMAVADCITGGAATNAITKVLRRRYSSSTGYDDPDRLVTFIDNHDVSRLYAMLGGTQDELVKAAYALIMTIPGVPQLYYGVEQGFKDESRAAMFQGGLKAAGTVQEADQFDEGNEWFRFFRQLIALRKRHRVFRYNRLSVIKDTDDSAGLFAYVIDGLDEDGSYMDGEGSKALFIMNTSHTGQVLSVGGTDLRAGDILSLQEPSSAGFERQLAAGAGGSLSVLVPPASYGIYLLTAQNAAAGGSARLELTLPPVRGEPSFSVWGVSSQDGTVRVVLNGEYENAVPVSVRAGQGFGVPVSTASLSNGTVTVQLVQELADGSRAYSEVKSFTVERPFIRLADAGVSDPEGDATGVGAAKGKLLPYTSGTYTGQQDILAVDVWRSGNDLRLDIHMKDVTDIWKPTANDFDHVWLSVFFDDGTGTGCRVHPGHNYTLPGGFAWKYLYMASGWTNTFFSAEGADAESYGTAASPAPSAAVDRDDAPNVISVTVRASSLGYPKSLSGWKIYINTWDEDSGSMRGMKAGDAEEWKYGSGSVPLADTPFVADETDSIIVIP